MHVRWQLPCSILRMKFSYFINTLLHAIAFFLHEEEAPQMSRRRHRFFFSLEFLARPSSPVQEARADFQRQRNRRQMTDDTRAMMLSIVKFNRDSRKTRQDRSSSRSAVALAAAAAAAVTAG